MSSDELKIRVLKFMVELLNWGLQICVGGGGTGPRGPLLYLMRLDVYYVLNYIFVS